MQELVHAIPYPLLVALGLAFVAGGIGFFGRQLSAGHGSDVRTVWYLYFLAAISTCVIAIWGSAVGAIDATGSFQGSIGKLIDHLLDAMLDLNADIMIFTALAGIVLGPQLGSYLVSGLIFGCAAPMRLVGTTFNLYIWSSAKSFVVAAGIFQALSLYGWAHGWKGWNARGVIALTSMSLLLVMLALCMLYVYRDISDPLGSLHAGTKSARARARWHAFMTRHAARP